MSRKTQKTVVSLFVSVLILALAGSIQHLSTNFPPGLETAAKTHLQAVLGSTDSILPTSTPVTTPSSIPSASPTATVSGELVKVVSVVDGDTIKIESGQTVRYIGIDTPETKHPTKKVQCYGKEASQRNQALVQDQYVRLEKDVSETDRYGRLLRYVWVGETLINQQLVAEGYAVASSYPPDVAKQPLFRTAEQIAREEGRGLWSACPAL